MPTPYKDNDNCKIRTRTYGINQSAEDLRCLLENKFEVTFCFLVMLGFIIFALIF